MSEQIVNKTHFRNTPENWQNIHSQLLKVIESLFQPNEVMRYQSSLTLAHNDFKIPFRKISMDKTKLGYVGILICSNSLIYINMVSSLVRVFFRQPKW